MIASPEQLFTEHGAALRAAARQVFQRSPEDVEDCVQGAMVRMLRFWDKREPEKTLHWAFKIVRHEAMDMIRRKRARGAPAEFTPIADIEQFVGAAGAEEALVARLTVESGLRLMTPRMAAALVAWFHGNRGEQMKTLQFRARNAFRSAVS